MSVELYICDLKPEVQEQVLSELNLSSAKEGNYDLFPLFVVENPELQNARRFEDNNYEPRRFAAAHTNLLKGQ